MAGLTFYLAWQFVGWLGLTHLQSRFLLPVVLPLAALVGLGFGAGCAAGRRAAVAARVVAGAVGIVFAVHAVAVAWNQAPTYRDERGTLGRDRSGLAG